MKNLILASVGMGLMILTFFFRLHFYTKEDQDTCAIGLFLMWSFWICGLLAGHCLVKP